MANTNTTVTLGPSGLSILGIIFVIAKLAGYIKWSWWLVLLPFWGGLALGLVLLILVFGIALLAAILGAIFN